MQRRRKARALPSVGLAILLMGFAVAPVIATQSPAYAVARSSGFSGPAPGKVTCSYLAKVTFSSPLTTAGGGTGFAPVKGKLSNCAATSSGLTISSGKITGWFAGSPVTCGATLTGAPAAFSLTWKSTYYGRRAKWSGSSVGFGNASGSFAGPASFTVAAPYASTVSPGCISKRGLKKIELSGTVTLGTPVVIIPVTPPPPGTWWVAPSGNLPWQWYLAGALNLGDPTEMGVNDKLPNGSAAPAPVVYDIDAIENPASTVHQLHLNGTRAICYIEVGTAGTYYTAAEEGIGTSYYDQLSADGDLGATLKGYPQEKFVNINSPSTVSIIESMIKQQCSDKGFDAVETDLDETYNSNEGSTGFGTFTEADEQNYLVTLADYMYSLDMGWIAKNLDDTGDNFAAIMEPLADGIISEQCNQYGTCGQLSSYLSNNKAVFNAEYNLATSAFCASDNASDINGALFNVALNGPRSPCR